MAEASGGEIRTKPVVCFVTLELFPTTPGGAGVLIAQTAHALLEQDYEVVFLFVPRQHQWHRFEVVI